MIFILIIIGLFSLALNAYLTFRLRNAKHLTRNSLREALLQRHPELTARDIEIAELINNGYTNDQLTGLYHVSPAAIQKAKYRLKQKLGLTPSDKLFTYLNRLRKQRLS